METERRPEPGREQGQTIVLVALALVALIAFVGLTTDVALVYVAKAHLQRAVDAAALAAANKLPDQVEARAAAYEFTRLHGYSFAPATDPLDIAFPISDPPRKIAAVTGTVEVDLAFLRVIGLQTAEVTAAGVGESAPLDVYLVLDLSASMWYDTAVFHSPPPCWYYASGHCRPPGCRVSDWTHYSVCVSKTCNNLHICDPLDWHIKPAADYFVSQLDPRYDRVGVISYDMQATRASPLTDDFNAVTTTIGTLNAYETSSPSTNIGDAILYADHYLSLPPPEEGGEGGRVDSVWAIVLLTDGAPTCWRNCPTCTLNCSSPICTKCENYTYANAQTSWDNHRITMYTICYGDRCRTDSHYRGVMHRIADITDNGVVDDEGKDYCWDNNPDNDQSCVTENFWSAPDEAGLRQALQEIAERIYTRLVR